MKIRYSTVEALLRRLWLTLVLLLLAGGAFAQDRAAQFKPLAAELAERRLAGGEEREAEQARALQIADALVLEQLNAALPPGADAITKAVEQLLAQPPRVGESYQVQQLGPAGRPFYLLVANFGLAGPSAVRIYAVGADRAAGYRLAARIDRFSQPEFFDEFLVIAPVAPQEGVFITVTGRTDELETGGYIAWRFAGAQLIRLWATDLLERSSYEVAGGELRLTHCEEADEDDPARCARTLRERFAWRNGGWQALERREIKP